MIYGIGVDLIEIDRIKQAIERNGQRFVDRVYTKAEQEYCAQRPSFACYAARFTAKEAFLKALGTGLRKGMRWLDIEEGHHTISHEPDKNEKAYEQLIKINTWYCEQVKTEHRPRGAGGGGDAEPTRVTALGPDGEVVSTASKTSQVLQPGSVIRVETSGGGGYGEA